MLEPEYTPRFNRDVKRLKKKEACVVFVGWLMVRAVGFRSDAGGGVGAPLLAVGVRLYAFVRDSVPSVLDLDYHGSKHTYSVFRLRG